MTITKLETDYFVQITKILFQILMFLYESKITPRKKFSLSIDIFVRSNTIFFNSSIVLLKFNETLKLYTLRDINISILLDVSLKRIFTRSQKKSS